MKAVFLSNYINHHQKPFSDALYERLGEEYHFIQTEPMSDERREMGWELDARKIPYVVFSYEQEERARQLIREADLVLAGWTLQTDLFLDRLKGPKLTLRVSERIYREGQWKAVSPRGLLAKYREHVRFRRAPVYLLCAGAYVASDFSLIGAYPHKMLRFGYFPPLRRYDPEALFAKKRRCGEGETQMVWAGRMIALKHPEYVVRLAGELKAAGKRFRIHFIGSGPMEETLWERIGKEGLSDCFVRYGFLTPEQVRDVMEKCLVHLFTSNYLEGWGAVVNEAMNSGCCVVANAQTGAAPFLIREGENGLLYPDGTYETFAACVKRLLERPEEMERMGRAAYRTISEEWNASHAAQECLRFYENWKQGKRDLPESGPFSEAQILPARWKYKEGKLQ